MRFEVLTAVKLSMLVFCVAGLKVETLFLCSYLPTNPHGITTQNSNMDKFVITSILHYFYGKQVRKGFSKIARCV
jgi:hypothetical protein